MQAMSSVQHQVAQYFK